VHFKESKRLLQKVYGQQKPELSEESVASVTSPQTTEMLVGRTPPLAPRVHENDIGSTSKHSRPDTAPTRADMGVGSHAQMQTLQREVQSLRDKNDHLTRALRKAEKSSDSFEREMSTERAYRRKVQTRLDDAERELEGLRRAVRERDEKLSKEETARRRVEEALSEDRRMRVVDIPLQGLPMRQGGFGFQPPRVGSGLVSNGTVGP
jgi:predicted RNase H-like nuclease (RuvC/YqgF family)